MALRWNRKSVLGVPVQLVNGHRYLSRWLGERPQATSCSAVLTSVQQAILQGANTPNWPWQGLVAASSVPGGFPAGMGNFPFTTPGYCPMWLDGVWTGQTTPVMDSSQIPAIPGFFNIDLFDATTGQQLVQAPTAPVPASGPCNPADLAFDPVTGIFRCAGQIIITPTTPPQIPNQPPVVPLPPFNVPTTPPIGAKPEEKKSVLPWVIGGGVVLIGGAILLSR